MALTSILAMKSTVASAPTSAEKVLEALLLFQPGLPVRVTDASTHLGISRSSAHRLLVALESRGFVHQDLATHAYLIGKALRLFSASLSRYAFFETAAASDLHQLTCLLRESVHIAVLDDCNATFVASAESSEQLHVSARSGSSFPAHATACGKVLLSELDIAELRRRYHSPDNFAGGRPRAIKSWSQLISELDHVRGSGFATNFEESEHNVGELAVPIRDQSGSCHGALSLTAPTIRFKRYKIETYVRELQRVAGDIGTKLHKLAAV